MAAAQVLQFPSGSLYEITDMVQALFDSLDGADSPEQKARIEGDLLLWIETEVRKVDDLCGYLGFLESQAAFADAEAKRLRERKALYESRAERVKSYCIAVMEGQGKRKLEGRTATLSLRACPASVEVLDEAAIPQAYKVTQTVVSIDKRAVKAALESGADVPGADLKFGKNTLVRR